MLDNIFDEIETLLQENKALDTENNTNKKICSPVSKPTKQKNDFDATNLQTSISSLDFFSNCPSSHEFLITDDGFQEDPQLFSVEQNELQPITSPFMVPGIYKKIPTAPTTAASADLAKAANVFLSEKEPKGRIVAAKEFQKLYARMEPPSEESNQLCRVNCMLVAETNSKSKPVESEDTSEQLYMLARLAHNIQLLSQRDHIVIDRKRNEIIRTEIGTNQKTIYRVLEPMALGLQMNTVQEKRQPNKPPIKLKLGRPRKNAILKKTVTVKVKEKETEKPDNETVPSAPILRTRSGRIVKTSNPPAKVASIAEKADDPCEASAELMRSFLAELKDCDFRCSKPISPLQPSAATTPTRAESPPQSSDNPTPTKRRIPPEAICPACKKIFLGKRLQRHFTQHPDHMLAMQKSAAPPPSPKENLCNGHENVSSTGEEMTLFRFLISKLEKSNLNEDQRADLFLNEINDLVEQLQLRSSRLIRNTSGLHLVTARTARVLGIPEGQYALDMNAIETPPEPEPICMNSYEHKNVDIMPVPSVNTRSLDYTTLSLDDEAAQKLNLSAGGKLLPPSEESLLRAVDDLVPGGMNKLVEASLLHPPGGGRESNSGSTLVPHYDHASDNAVEAMSMKETSSAQQTQPILDLSVDFFQFNKN